jgi:hypothetical protein
MKRGIDLTSSHQKQLVTMLLLSVAIVCISPIVAGSDVYTWTDENGIEHYSDIPPEQQDSKVINILGVPQTGTTGAYPQATDSATAGAAPDSDQPSAAEQRREELAKVRTERRAEKAKLDIECARYRQLLARMEPARRVILTNEEGEAERLDDDQRMEIVNKSKAFIAKNCE